MPALEKIMMDDYPTFSGIALERWFRQKMMESCRYKIIGGWWKPGGVNTEGKSDKFEIDIVAETLEREVEAYGVSVIRKKQSRTAARESGDDATSPVSRQEGQDVGAEHG